eukprot:635918_1
MLPHTKQSNDDIRTANHTQMKHALNDSRSSVIAFATGIQRSDLSARAPMLEAVEDQDRSPRTHFPPNKTPQSLTPQSRLSQSRSSAIPGHLSRAIRSTTSVECTEEFEEEEAFIIQMNDIEEGPLMMELAEMPPDIQRNSSQANAKNRQSIIDIIAKKTKHAC